MRITAWRFAPLPLVLFAALPAWAQNAATGAAPPAAAAAAAVAEAKVDTGETVIVGVNRYRLDSEPEIDILEVDNAKVRSSQIARLDAMRSRRDDAAVRAALDALASFMSGNGASRQ